jgi:hypothetical protein
MKERGMKYSSTMIRQMAAERTEATNIVERLNVIAVARQAKYDELWELERQGSELRGQLLSCYQHIDSILTGHV